MDGFLEANVFSDIFFVLLYFFWENCNFNIIFRRDEAVPILRRAAACSCQS